MTEENDDGKKYIAGDIIYDVKKISITIYA